MTVRDRAEAKIQKLQVQTKRSSLRLSSLNFSFIMACAPATDCNHLSVGHTFTLTLKEPDVTRTRRPPGTISRALPSLPYGVKTEYLLVKALQEGKQWWSQVWLAKPLKHQSCGEDVETTHVVFKFMVPSRLGIREENYEDPRDTVGRIVATYNSLTELQGSTVPYLFGRFEVSTVQLCFASCFAI